MKKLIYSIVSLACVLTPIATFATDATFAADWYHYDSNGQLDHINHDDGTATYFYYLSDGKIHFTIRK